MHTPTPDQAALQLRLRALLLLLQLPVLRAAGHGIKQVLSSCLEKLQVELGLFCCSSSCRPCKGGVE